jgi:hypothetical protein
MRKIRAEKEQQPEGEQMEYLPMSFDSMISYLSFCTSRKELQKSIEDNSQTN